MESHIRNFVYLKIAGISYQCIMADNEEEVFLSESSSDDENDTDEEDQCDTTAGSRGKRDTRLSMNKPNCYWPPNPATSWPAWTHLRPVRFGNPTYGPRMQLFSSTGWHLAIYDRRNVRGSTDERDRHTFLELSYAGVPGHVRIQALENHLYLAMDTRGHLYAEPDATSDSTIFIESLAGSYNVYLSRKFAHLGWYFGIKKSGKIKKGPNTALNQRAIKFLPRRSNIQT